MCDIKTMVRFDIFYFPNVFSRSSQENESVHFAMTHQKILQLHMYLY